MGESVLVATGSVASAWFANHTTPPIDALIIGIVDEKAASPAGS